MKKATSYVAAFAVGAAACAVGLKTFGDPISYLGNSASKQAVLASLTTTPPIHRGIGDSVVADAAAKVDSAVVTVHTLGKVARSSNAFSDDPRFRSFFGGGDPSAQEAPRGAGSGVIISSDGYIITNDHVVKDTAKLTINVGNNGKAYTAHVVGTDPITDIAVVKIDTAGVKLPVAQLGNSDDVRIGDWAIAVGNPLDVGTTVTLGIISALGRTGSAGSGQAILRSIQTDAAINPGNSGGALANINGQVIGINEAILSPSGTSSGIGFAIPINRAKQVAAELIKNGKAIHPYMGVAFKDIGVLSLDDRTQVGIPTGLDYGVYLDHVAANSPASAGGLHRFDVITDANGQRITSKDQLNGIIQTAKIGSVVTINVLRDGQPRTLAVTLRERPASFDMELPQPQQGQQGQQGQQDGNPFGQLPFGQP